MAAKHAINPQQLKLFMSGTELQSYVNESGDLAPLESMDDMWKRKTEEAALPRTTLEDDGVRAHGAGVKDSIKEHGFLGTIHVEHASPSRYMYNERGQKEGAVRFLWDGHHRVAAAADMEHETGRNVWVPTTHIEGDGMLTRSQFQRVLDAGNPAKWEDD